MQGLYYNLHYFGGSRWLFKLDMFLKHIVTCLKNALRFVFELEVLVLFLLTLSDKSLQFLIIFSFFFSSAANLDQSAKVVCPFFRAYSARSMWPNSVTLEDIFVKILLIIIESRYNQYLFKKKWNSSGIGKLFNELVKQFFSTI